MKTTSQIKKEYYTGIFSSKEIDYLIKKYGDKPATSGEASYVLRIRFRELILAIISIFNKK